MRRAGLALAGLALVLTGCGGPEEVTINEDGSLSNGATYAPDEPDDDAPDESAYLAALHGSAVSFAEVTDDALIQFGDTVCAALTRGDAVKDIVAVAHAGFAADGTRDAALTAGILVGGASTHLCPEHEQAVLEWATSVG